jgi:2-hydroxy-3-keto-5-methylthiopentenyl-1-phosphate phosphatase
MFYAGDGVSDLSAAKETDLLFAKAGKGASSFQYGDLTLCANSCETDLVTWCELEKVPFVTFNDWTSISQTVKDIVAGKITVQEAAKGRI